MVLTHTTRTDDAFTYLRQRITDGQIPFGCRLNINYLAEETGFSTTPIRESLVKLEMVGLVESMPHKGVFVVSPCKQELLEMIDGRLCLELFMARSVIQNVTKSDIEKLRQACVRVSDDHSDTKLFFEEGLHGQFAQISGNKFLERIYTRVMVLLNILYIQGMKSCNNETWINAYRLKHREEENKIVDAIEAGDLEKLETAISEHINNFRDFLLITLEKWRPSGLRWDDDR
jgi:DNA-binding GntR family transcriptional regulator